MNTNSHIYPTAIVCGLLSAALAMAVMRLISFPPLAVLVGCFVATPIFIAAFGWGTKASFIAIIVATLALLVAEKSPLLFIEWPITGLTFSLLFFLPGFYAAWLLGLAKNIEPDTQTAKKANLIWFPLSSILYQSTVLISLVTILLAFYYTANPPKPETINPFIDYIIENITASPDSSGFDLAAFRQYLQINFTLYSIILISTYSLLLFIGNLYASTKIAKKMGRLKRPSDDWPSRFRLPLNALILFAVSFVLSYFAENSSIGVGAMIFEASLTTVFSIAGLAYLHEITKPLKARLIILSLVYFLILSLVLTLPISIIILMMGIWATIREWLNLKNNPIKL